MICVIVTTVRCFHVVMRKSQAQREHFSKGCKVSKKRERWRERESVATATLIF